MMRAALAVQRVATSPEQNLNELLRSMRRAAQRGAELVVFAEASFTGLANDDIPAHDLALGTPVDGPLVQGVCAEAGRLGLHVALGLLEEDQGRLYDSALLIDRMGNVVFRYRRVSPGWRGPDADGGFYGEGSDVDCFAAEFGRVALLICGDLFDDGLVARVRQERPDLLLVPFARALAGGGQDQSRWDQEELPQYEAQVRKARTTALLVNYLDDDYVGGAMVIGADGSLKASLPLGRADILLTDL